MLDTNVMSELRRPRPNRQVVEFVENAPASQLFVSVASIAELRVGIEMTEDPATRDVLGQWLDRTVRPMFERRILALSEDVLERWLRLIGQGRRMRRTFPYPDVLIAATAAHHDLAVVTRNVRDFEPLRVAVINPWVGT